MVNTFVQQLKNVFGCKLHFLKCSRKRGLQDSTFLVVNFSKMSPLPCGNPAKYFLAHMVTFVYIA